MGGESTRPIRIAVDLRSIWLPGVLYVSVD